MNKRKITINFIVEGQTEEHYLKHFKNEYLDDEFVFKIKNIKNGNYKSFIDRAIQRNSYTYFCSDGFR